MVLNKHQIFANDDLKYKLVDMLEWGGVIKLRALSVEDQLNFDKFIADEPSDIDMALYLIMISCVSEDNIRIFDNGDLKDLKLKSAESILKIFHEILALNKQKKNDVEDLAKN